MKQELDNADKRFAADQKIQNEDINILIERIDNQVWSFNLLNEKKNILLVVLFFIYAFRQILYRKRIDVSYFSLRMY